MEFQDKRILVCSHYSAPYAGNFIKSFLFLSKYVSEIAFVFPLETKERDWIKDIKHKVYFASPVSPKSCQELESIIQDFQPNIVHCNFEGYDIAAVQAIRHLDMKKHCKVVWQLHDAFSYVPHPIKSLISEALFLPPLRILRTICSYLFGIGSKCKLCPPLQQTTNYIHP